jgi:hypothetical protein
VAIGSLAWITVVAGVGGPLLYFTLIKQPVLGVPVAATTVPGLALPGSGCGWRAVSVARVGRVRGPHNPVPVARPVFPVAVEASVVVVPGLHGAVVLVALRRRVRRCLRRRR